MNILRLFNFLIKKYRIVGEYDEAKKCMYWGVQVRVNFFEWKDLVSNDREALTNPYLSSYDSLSFKRKENAIKLLDNWKEKISYKKPKNIVEYLD